MRDNHTERRAAGQQLFSEKPLTCRSDYLEGGTKLCYTKIN